MLSEVLGHLNNWFCREIIEGDFTITGGGITLPLLDGQYFRICDSVMNDGLHQHPSTDLVDETFTGTVWVLEVPRDVVALADEIQAWSEKNQPSAYTSESFGGYSYSKATGANGAPLSWQDVFRGRLNQYRKMPGVYGRHEIHVPRRPWNPDYPFGGEY